jgi:hypothetical protein
VRSTRYRDGHLAIYEKDTNEAVFILALLHDLARGGVELAGYIHAAEGKRDQWWRTSGLKRPAYFVQQSALAPVEELPGYRLAS